MNRQPDLADLVAACAPYFDHLGIHPAWIARWAGLSDADRTNARDKVDNWLGHYLDACCLLRTDPIDQDAARDLATRWPRQLLHYAERCSYPQRKDQT